MNPYAPPAAIDEPKREPGPLITWDESIALILTIVFWRPFHQVLAFILFR